MGDADTAGPDPRRITTAAGLARELDLLRSRAAHGARRARLSLDELARRTGIPRSTVHSYVRGVRLPPPDSLDDLVIAMGATEREQREWAEALFRVTADRFDSTPAAPLATSPGSPAVPRQLPAAPRVLVGRADELGRLDALLATAEDDGAPLVVGISGTGGIGKTALALRWAHQVAARFPDGQLWLDLRGYSPGAPLEPVDALERLLRSVGLTTTELAADTEARAATFRSAVAGKRLLLLLDNARDSAQVLPLLPGTAGCVTVITSRTALRSLAAIGGADTLLLDRLPAPTALSLIDVGPAGADAAVTERIARHCGGLPLALRIVRERLSRASAAEVERFADELAGDDGGRLAALALTDAGSDLSVRGALRWSYEALAPEAAALFRLLPLCYQSTFERRSAAVVHAVDEQEARRLLDLLVDASLLDTAGPDRYRVHDLVLAFAEDCLQHDEQAAVVAAARRRMLGHLIALAEDAVRRWDPTRPMRIPVPPDCPAGTPAGQPDPPTGHVEAFALAMTDAFRSGLDDCGWALGERAARAVWPLADLGVLEPALLAGVASAREAARRWPRRRCSASSGSTTAGGASWPRPSGSSPSPSSSPGWPGRPRTRRSTG
ncbi:MAG TPA: NB-ARC domain-containing protein [Jatrophihabitans sp.]|nr:NB-ARC domain-containing protein [Jatrophihabitans sp.]